MTNAAVPLSLFHTCLPLTEHSNPWKYTHAPATPSVVSYKMEVYNVPVPGLRPTKLIVKCCLLCPGTTKRLNRKDYTLVCTMRSQWYANRSKVKPTGLALLLSTPYKPQKTHAA